MSFTVKAIDDLQYVLVRHEGQLTNREFEEASSGAKRMLDEHNWNKLLIDVRNAAYLIPVADVYYIMISISKGLPLVKIVLVFPPERKEEGEFAETVAANRGVRLKSFWDYDDAVAWLTANPQLAFDSIIFPTTS